MLILIIACMLPTYPLLETPRGGTMAIPRHGETASLDRVEGLLQLVSQCLKNANVTQWLFPGQILRKTSSGEVSFPSYVGGGVLAVHQDETPKILAACSAVRNLAHVPVDFVETLYGIRIFLGNGMSSARLDYTEPFVDLMVFEEKDGLFVNSCCDCEKTVAGPCMKRMCGCLFCAFKVQEIMPTTLVSLEGTGAMIPSPRMATWTVPA